MDTARAKAIIHEQCRRRVRLSGGPEVFRRMVGGPSELADAAVQELVAEGVLKETVLRVGRLYHYPANEKASLVYLQEQLEKMKQEAAARPARPVVREPAVAARPAAAPAPAGTAAGAAPAAAAAAGAAPTAPATGPSPASPPAGATPAFTGPIRARKKSELAAEAAGSTPLAAPATEGPSVPPAAPGPVLYTGPIRAKKKSQLAAEAAAVAEAPPSSEETAAPPPAAPGPVVYTGPIKAKKKSELAAEAAAQSVSADGGSAPATVSSPTAAASSANVPPVDVEAPKVYTGPIKAKKKSQLDAEAAGRATPAEADSPEPPADRKEGPSDA